MMSRDLSRNPEFNVPFLDFVNIICLCIFLEDNKLTTKLLSGANLMRHVMYNTLNSDLNKMWGGQISSKINLYYIFEFCKSFPS